MELAPEVREVMERHGVPPRCIGCLVMQQRAHVWLAMELMDQAAGGPDPDPAIAAVKPTAAAHLLYYPRDCMGTTDGQCHSPQIIRGTAR